MAQAAQIHAKNILRDPRYNWFEVNVATMEWSFMQRQKLEPTSTRLGQWSDRSRKLEVVQGGCLVTHRQPNNLRRINGSPGFPFLPTHAFRSVLLFSISNQGIQGVSFEAFLFSRVPTIMVGRSRI